MESIKYIIIVLISSFIGYLTNYLAIKLLFHPKKPINLYFFKIWGIIYKRKKKLAKNISDSIEKYLFTKKDIKNALKNNEEEFLKNMEDFILKNFEKKIPIMFQGVAQKIIHEVIYLNKDKITKIIEEKFLDKILKNVDIKKIIEEKIINFNIMELEKIVYKTLGKELKFIELSGAVVGLFIGFIQILIFNL